MNEHAQRSATAARWVRYLCVAVLLLVLLAYGVSYRLLLVDDSAAIMKVTPADAFIIIPPQPKACYREEYVVGGENVRRFFRPANRIHQFLDRHLFSHWQ